MWVIVTIIVVNEFQPIQQKQQRVGMVSAEKENILSVQIRQFGNS